MHPTPDILLPDLKRLCASLTGRFGAIPAARIAILQDLIDYISGHLTQGAPCRVTAICTHNSRRSHFTQVWIAMAADHYGVRGIATFSGGTEATAFNPRAVRALERAGLLISSPSSGEKNPFYQLRWREDMQPYLAFSKVYDAPPNPSRDFAAVLVCSAAAADCPIVAGADTRIALPYDDPKDFDGTEQEDRAYDDRFREIGRDMLYVMARVSQIIGS